MITPLKLFDFAQENSADPTHMFQPVIRIFMDAITALQCKPFID